MKICVFGDSICFGQGVSLAYSWICRLAGAAYEYGQQKGASCNIENYSINGNTTRMALERMPYDIQSKRPEILIVQFGMNDCNYWLTDAGVPRVSPKAFAANLEEIIDRARVFGARRVLLNTNHPSGLDHNVIPNTSITYQQSNAAYNEVIRQVAGAAGDDVTLVDMEKRILEHASEGKHSVRDYLLDDMIHLSLLGHDVYYSYYQPILLHAIDEVINA